MKFKDFFKRFGHTSHRVKQGVSTNNMKGMFDKYKTNGDKIKMLRTGGVAEYTLTPTEVKEICAKYQLTPPVGVATHINSNSPITITVLPNGHGRIKRHG